MYSRNTFLFYIFFSHCEIGAGSGLGKQSNTDTHARTVSVVWLFRQSSDRLTACAGRAIPLLACPAFGRLHNFCADAATAGAREAKFEEPESQPRRAGEKWMGRDAW